MTDTIQYIKWFFIGRPIWERVWIDDIAGAVRILCESICLGKTTLGKLADEMACASGQMREILERRYND